MRGKTEVELYKGNAAFSKIYARDISKNYEKGKLSFVFYAKPSALLYSECGSSQEYVKQEDIEPLVLEGIVIKSKKKE